MSEATFRGGVHPYEGKELSSDLPIKTVMPTGEMVFPMGQHIGAPATPIVAKGDKVLVLSLIHIYGCRRFYPDEKRNRL